MIYHAKFASTLVSFQMMLASKAGSVVDLKIFELIKKIGLKKYFILFKYLYGMWRTFQYNQENPQGTAVSHQFVFLSAHVIPMLLQSACSFIFDVNNLAHTTHVNRRISHCISCSD